jgi:IAA-amino acid hydrolase
VFLAAAGALEIVIHGRGGHAAMPQFAIDPVTAAAHLVTALQSVVSRELDPLVPGVISITTVHGGETHNVIPAEVRMSGTIRSLTLDGLRGMQRRTVEIAEATALAHRCRAEVGFPGNAYPPTVNDPRCWELGRAAAREVLGEGAVRELDPVMGGEDFAFYAERIPACFVAIGIRNEAEGSIYSVHHPAFKADEEVLPLGAAVHATFALRALDDLWRSRRQ